MLDANEDRQETAAGNRDAMPIPGTRLYYDPLLVQELTADHQELLGMYNQVSVALEANNYKKIRPLLAEFSQKLREHLLTENIKLYVYLSHVFADDAQNRETVISFKREMTQIGQTINRFLMRYADQDWLPGYETSFPAEFKAIGGALLKRINQEETILYRLYMPPTAYKQ